MPRQKKSRKIGQIGTPKTSHNIRKPAEKRIRKPKGKPAGSRNSESIESNDGNGKHIVKDPRHGSKKPIQLTMDKVNKKSAPAPKIRHFSPAQELAAIEQDEKLSSLLERVELGKNINQEQQQYVDEKLARHKALCDMLGVTEEPEEKEESENQNSDDLFSKFDAINIDDFKD